MDLAAKIYGTISLVSINLPLFIFFVYNIADIIGYIREEENAVSKIIDNLLGITVSCMGLYAVHILWR